MKLKNSISDEGMKRVAQQTNPSDRLDQCVEQVLDAVYAVMETLPEDVDPGMVLRGVQDSLSVHSTEGWGIPSGMGI